MKLTSVFVADIFLQVARATTTRRRNRRKSPAKMGDSFLQNLEWGSGETAGLPKKIRATEIILFQFQTWFHVKYNTEIISKQELIRG